MFEQLNGYKSIFLDYSVLLEYADNPVFDEFLQVVDTGIDLYVDKSFKALHYCVLHIKDPKDRAAAAAMKKICSVLLSQNRLHLIRELEIDKVALNINEIADGCCVLATRNSIFIKRLYEKRPFIACDIAILAQGVLNVFDSLDSLMFSFPQQEPSRLAYNSSYIESFGSASISDVVNTENDDRYELVKRMSGGAEGMVFTTNVPGCIAKIYHKGIITPLRWAKLKKLTELKITGHGFCIPKDLVFFRNSPVGYTMTLGKGTTLGTVFDGPDAILEAFPEWTRLDIVNVLLKLIEKYLYLHMHDVIAGDIQLKNALIDTNGDVYLIDMDSVQIGNLPCPVGTEEFTDTRLWGKDFSKFLRELRDEDYSIAMLVFSVLFCGLHPYATRNGAETLREEILNYNFPYNFENEPEFIPVGGYDHIWEYLPERMRKMLFETFKNGWSYDALEWLDAVVKYKEDLENYVFDDPEAYKVFPKENYKQASVNVEEAREALKNKTAHKASATSHTPAPVAAPVANKPIEPAVVDDKPVFAKPSENSVPENSPFAAKARFSNVPTGKYIPKDQLASQDEIAKKKKFFGLF
ncbi:MAG: hypothetical protein Q3987_04585 [Oscillospiraceae bacterium]|nr:hypothetical protein [Oscillospiraceae bacterium]